MITDLLSAEAVSDPHAVYRSLREHAPITWLPEHRAWFVATHEGVQAAFRDARLSSDRLTPLEARMSDDKRALLGDTFDLLRGWMVFHDPPHHERLKAPVRRAFTPRAVEGLRPFVERVVDECLDTIAVRLAEGEQVDLVEHLAFPLPAIVIAELLGVPASDRDDFKHWSNELSAIVFGASADPRQAERAAAGSAQFTGYFTELIAHVERHPGDNLISALIAAKDLADPPLSAVELVGACTLLLFGGHETTTSLIGNATAALLDDRAALGTFVGMTSDVAAVAHAVEELHRFDGSSKVMVRIAAETHLAAPSVEIAAGQTVFLGIASANRDPAVFSDPDRLALDRPNAGKHLGFGVGLHFCLGAPLARLESQIAVGRLFGRFGDRLELACDHAALRWGATILGRGLASLPVSAVGTVRP